MFITTDTIERKLKRDQSSVQFVLLKFGNYSFLGKYFILNCLSGFGKFCYFGRLQ